MLTCAACGHQNPDENRFCGGCGAPLEVATAPSRETRKVVTVLFTDVSRSTELGERLDPESLRSVMSRYFEQMRTVLERHEATVEKFIGDAVMAVFGIPTLHEDDALRAVRAAVEMRAELRDLNDELEQRWGVRLEVRTGINTGEVVAGDARAGQTLVTGDAVNIAARLEQSAAPGEILIGRATHGLVSDAVDAEEAGELELKGKAGLVAALRLVNVHARVAGRSRRLDSPMVGRQRERTLVRQAFERCAGDQACQLFTVLGSAGVGKSRFVLEFIREAEKDARVVSGRCLSYGEGITYWPLTEAVKEAAAIVDDDSRERAVVKLRSLLNDAPEGGRVAELIAEATGLTPAAASSEEIFWAVRKLFEHLAQDHPLVVVFDDVHWAEPTFLELLEHLADWFRDAPLLLLCVARPELLDVRPNWGGGKPNATTILLEPLTVDESQRLIANLLGSTGLPLDTVSRIAAAAEGNPLFVEEMVRMLIDDGLLFERDGAWVAKGTASEIAVPPTIQALLAARLDRLKAAERDLMERASVVGKVFYRGAVSELSPEAVRGEIAAHLSTLTRKELIRPDRSAFAGQDAYRFRHILIRDAAYEAMPKETRRDLHERFAAWLRDASRDRLAEYEEVVAHHLAEAYRYTRELGRHDEGTHSLARSAAEIFAAAARRARERGDHHAAARLNARAVELDRAGGGDRWPLWSVEDANSMWSIGQQTQLVETLEEARKAAEDANEASVALRARSWQLTVRFSTDPEGTTDEIRNLVEAAVPTLERAGDDVALATLYSHLSLSHAITATWRELEDTAAKAIFHARRAGAHDLEDEANRWLGAAIYYGPRPAREAHELIENTRYHATELDAHRLEKLGVLRAQMGDVDGARRLIERSQALFQEYGMEFGLAGSAFWSVPVEIAAGDLDAAEAALRGSIDRLQAIGDASYASTLAVWLADLISQRGSWDEAERWAMKGLGWGSSDDAVTQAWGNAVLGRIAGLRGDHEGAIELARGAVAMIESAQDVEVHAATLGILAEVLWLAGHDDEAAEVETRALEMYSTKGFTALRERLRARLAERRATR